MFDLTRRALGLAALTACLTLASSTARAQDFFGPKGGDFLAPAGGSFNQIWGKVATDSAGSFYAYSWTSGNDVFARFYEADGSPRTSNKTCNPNLNNGTQDENAISIDENGNVLVAWSERSGYDGELMGIFGRAFDSAGVPYGAEFQINVEWQASQWRPLLHARPGGGWIVMWSGQWDGEAFFRILDTDGTPLSGDLQVNTFENGAQVDTAGAIAPDGTIFMVFVDYSGFGAVGSGTNVWGRLFDSSGAPLQAQEFLVANTASGDQREPRVAADGMGRFVVVWEDDTHDNSTWGVFARRIDAAGSPMGSQFQVNTTSPLGQRKPDVKADDSGNFIVVWEHNTGSSNAWNIAGQRYDDQGVAVDAEFTVNEILPGAQRLPSLAIDGSGRNVVFAWEGPGNQTDVFSRFYLSAAEPVAYCTGKVNSLGCVPYLSFTGLPSLTDTSPFRVTANDVVPLQAGIFVYGVTGRLNLNFHSGKLCVKSPLIRFFPPKVNNSNGPLPCQGKTSRNFNSRIQSGVDPLLALGQKINAQYLYRDTLLGDGFNDGLTGGLEFVIVP